VSGGDEDRPALWFYVDIGEHKELGLCIGWRYEEALDVARGLAAFLSYELVDLVSDSHRVRAVRVKLISADHKGMDVIDSKSG
jgi:hypothetical protein